VTPREKQLTYQVAQLTDMLMVAGDALRFLDCPYCRTTLERIRKGLTDGGLAYLVPKLGTLSGTGDGGCEASRR
jgi:hypothetical protein